MAPLQFLDDFNLTNLSELPSIDFSDETTAETAITERDDLHDWKLQKVLARSGYGSRREIEAMIGAGRIRVNGKVAQVGERIDADASVRIDGHEVVIKSENSVSAVFRLSQARRRIVHPKRSRRSANSL